MSRNSKFRHSQVLQQLIREQEVILLHTREVPPEINPDAHARRNEVVAIVKGLKLIVALGDFDASARPSRSERARERYLKHFAMLIMYTGTPKKVSPQDYPAFRSALMYLHEMHQEVGTIDNMFPRVGAPAS